MAEVARIWFTAKQKAELWERWRAGQCVADIARALLLLTTACRESSRLGRPDQSAAPFYAPSK